MCNQHVYLQGILREVAARGQAPSLQRADDQVGTRRHSDALTVAGRRVGTVQASAPSAVLEDDVQVAGSGG